MISVILSDLFAEANFLLIAKLPVVSIDAIKASSGFAEFVFV